MRTIEPTIKTDCNTDNSLSRISWNTVSSILFAVGSFWLLLLRFLFLNFAVANGGQQAGLFIPKDNMAIHAVLFMLQVVSPTSLLLFGYTKLNKYLKSGLLASGQTGLKLNRMKYASRFLYFFPFVYILLSAFKLAHILKYIKFEESTVAGMYRILIEDGLSFPTFAELDVTGKSIYICLIALALSAVIYISVEIYRINKKPSKKEILIDICEFLLFFLTAMAWLAWKWVKANFGTISVDQILFHLMVPLKGADNSFIQSFVTGCILPAFVLAAPVFLVYVIFKKNRTCIKLKLLNQVKRISISSPKFLIVIPTVLLVFSAGYCLKDLGFIEYAKLSLLNTGFIEKNYRDPQETQMVFPEKKRNLIYIFMESMEATYLSNDLGGFTENNLIPELAEMAQNNISFSNGEQLGGAIQLPYTGWTIAAMVSHHGGIPLKIPDVVGNDYGGAQSFLPGAYTMGDILQKEGYNQTLLVGSDADFGGRKSYYTQHGQFKILDLFTARQDGIIPPDYYVWWGYEDLKLYEYAKKELLELSSQDKPFNLTMLTVDTHHIGGYYCSLCKNQYPTQYWNVQACASRQIQAFVEWIKQQDFYESTTIVIAGDHLSMDPLVSDMVGDILVENDDVDFYDYNGGYRRTTLNVFINAVKEPAQIHNRLFSTMDMFPTTLSAMGVIISGDRLALGTDLFSNTPTLLEEYGEKAVSEGLRGSSKLFDAMLMGDAQKFKEVSE